MTISESDEQDDFNRRVAEMRHLLGIEGNVLAYTEVYPSINEPGVVARVRYQSTFDPTGTVEVTNEWTEMVHDREEER